MKKRIFKGLVIGITTTLLFSSCAAILLPSKQKITVVTDNKESEVYINKEQIGKGTTIVHIVKKEGPQQVVTQTPGYKDEYSILYPTHVAKAYAPLRLLSYVCFVYPGLLESVLMSANDKKYSYESVNNFSSRNKLILRENKKYVNVDAISVDIKNLNKEIVYHTVIWEKDINKAIQESEKEVKKEQLKEELKQAKAEKKKGKKKQLNNAEDNKMKYDDTKFSENLYKTLKKSGFIDTVNKVFQDDYNTINVEGTIKKISIFNITKGLRGGYQTSKLTILWKVKNTYGEIIDSISRDDFSGDFLYSYSKSEEQMEKMFADAVDVSFNKLLSDDKFKKYLEVQTYKNPTDPLIKIQEPKTLVKEVADAPDAAVIIKRKDKGHGSGFAISQDGYILTNFHVISDKYVNKFAEIKVIMSNGDEVPVKVVRVNKAKDLALLKVEKTFDKAFKLDKNKTFKKLQEVYTVGAPKSIELGQSVTIGILSNERNANNNTVLQLSMAINPGNSGGPLFDKQGILHGVIQSKLVGYATEGVGFAIPAYLISDYLNIGY